MGLDIDGFRSEKTYHYGYSGLHQIRAMAVWVAGKCDTWQEAFDFLMFEAKKDDLWNTNYYDWLEREGLLEFRQLLHFADHGGVMVKGYYLEKIDISRSFLLGDLDRLYEELEVIRETITSDPKKYPVPEGRMRIFWMLYNLVKEEAETGVAIHFH